MMGGRRVDDPAQEMVTAIEVWEQAENYGQPERFFGLERAERFRAGDDRVTGRYSIRPPAQPGGRA